MKQNPILYVAGVAVALTLMLVTMGPSSGGGGNGNGNGGSGSNSVIIASGTNTLVKATTNSGVITFTVNLTDPVNLRQLVTTNTVVPTNIVSDGTTVDFSKSEWTLLLASNITVSSVSGLTNGYYNATIWHVKASGADRTITLASWTNSPNIVIASHVINVTNGTWVDILHSCQPTVDTNSAVRTH